MDIRDMELKEMNIGELKGFRDDPFIKENDQGFVQLIDVIEKCGIPNPLTAFVNEDGEIEVITGERILEACRHLGFETVPVIKRDVTRDDAIIAHISERLSVRDRILPSEKARAYKMLRDAYSSRGEKLMEDGRTDYTDKKLEEVAQECFSQIRRYIRLNELIPELLKLVDEGRMALRPAVEISYLSEKFQHIINDFYEIEQVTPSLAQAIKMKKMDKENNLDEEDIENILSEEKANQKKSSINLSQDFCTRYFPKCHTRSEVEGEILKLIRKLESYEAVKADTRGKEEMAV